MVQSHTNITPFLYKIFINKVFIRGCQSGGTVSPYDSINMLHSQISIGRRLMSYISFHYSNHNRILDTSLE